MALMTLPVDLGLGVLVGYVVIGLPPFTVPESILPWWAFGLILGVLVLWAPGLAWQRYLDRLYEADTTPVSLDLTHDGMVVLLPPLRGSKGTALRELSISWDRVGAVRQPRLLAFGRLSYHGRSTPSVAVAGTPERGRLTLSAEAVRQTEMAWKAWQTRARSTDGVLPP